MLRCLDADEESMEINSTRFVVFPGKFYGEVQGIGHLSKRPVNHLAAPL